MHDGVGRRSGQGGGAAHHVAGRELGRGRGGKGRGQGMEGAGAEAGEVGCIAPHQASKPWAFFTVLA